MTRRPISQAGSDRLREQAWEEVRRNAGPATPQQTEVIRAALAPTVARLARQRQQQQQEAAQDSPARTRTAGR